MNNIGSVGVDSEPFSDMNIFKAVTVSPKIFNLPYLSRLIGANEVLFRPSWSPAFLARNCSHVLAWGNKQSAIKAERFATRLNIPLLRVEDGFLRSFGLGFSEPPSSLVVDDIGIYYDATRESRLERLVKEPLSSVEESTAKELLAIWCSSGVSKYNHCVPYLEQIDSPTILVVDQTFGDASISYGLADEASFLRMLDAAISLYPTHRVLLKVHPDVFSGKKRGHYSTLSSSFLKRVEVLTENYHAPDIIRKCEAVFCVTSQIGFEALLHGKKVYTFGMPFYAGWGLTIDALSAPSRRHAVTLEQLVYSALVKYPRYIDPKTKKTTDVESCIKCFSQMREQFYNLRPL